MSGNMWHHKSLKNLPNIQKIKLLTKRNNYKKVKKKSNKKYCANRIMLGVSNKNAK